MIFFVLLVFSCVVAADDQAMLDLITTYEKTQNTMSVDGKKKKRSEKRKMTQKKLLPQS